MTEDKQTPKVEYFVVRNLGYDGLIINKFATKEEAETHYSNEQKEIRKWIEKYGEKTADRGLALIEGKILKSEDMSFDW